MEIVKLTKDFASEWDQVVYSSPDGWCFSLSSWLAMVTPIWNMEDRSFAIRENGKFVAVMPLHWIPASRRLSSGGWGHGGPAILSTVSPADRQRLWGACFGKLEAIANELSAERIDISISPVTQSSLSNRWGVNPLAEIGFRDVSTSTQILDLRQDESQLLAGLKKDTRQQIKKARLAGYSVELRPWKEMVETYYRVHTSNYERTGVPPHPRAYFEGIAQEPAEHYLLWVGISPDGLPVAFHNTALFGKGAMYHTGCSETAHLNSGINYLLFAEALRGAKDRGCEWYEAGEVFYEEHESKKGGLTIFKTKFGGEIHRLFRGELILEHQILADLSSAPPIGPALKPTLRANFRNWLRATRDLLISLFGRTIILKLQSFVYSWIALFRKLKQGIRSVYLRQTKPLIRFIRPYWDDLEIECYTTQKEIGFQESLDLFIREFQLAIALPKDSLVIPTGSGRTALELGLRTLKKKNPTRNKVLLPTYGCKGTIDPIIRAGLIPVFVDNTNELLMDIEKTKEMLGPDVLACLLVHLCGMQIDTASIIQIAREKKGIAIIEDRAHFLGGENLYPADETPDFAIYSFGMGKNIMASAGGALVAYNHIRDASNESKNLQFEDEDLARYRFGYFFSKFFNSKKPLHTPADVLENARTSPYKFSHMNPIDALALVQQLKKMQEIIEKRQRNGRFISASLLQFPALFMVQPSMHHIFTKLSVVLRDSNDLSNFRSYLSENGIETEAMYTPLHLREFGRPFHQGSLPIADSIHSLVTNIPVRPDLTQRELKRITDAIEKFGMANS